MFLSDSHSDGTHSLMQRHIYTNLMKKQTHPHLGWPKGEVIFIKCPFLDAIRKPCISGVMLNRLIASSR